MVFFRSEYKKNNHILQKNNMDFVFIHLFSSRFSLVAIPCLKTVNIMYLSAPPHFTEEVMSLNNKSMEYSNHGAWEHTKQLNAAGYNKT